MKLVKYLAFVFFVLYAICVPLAAQVVFHNNDGTFVSTGNTTGTLSLTGSTLVQVDGLTAYGIPNTPGNLGTVVFTTGTIASGSIVSGATFNPGGTFTVTYQNGTIFSGSFGSGGTWLLVGSQYTFVGSVNGTLSVPGYEPAVVMGAAVQLTTAGSVLNHDGNGYSITDGGGTSSFNLPPGGLTPVPEPGTLTLLGSGLLGLGVFVRRLRNGRPSDAR